MTCEHSDFGEPCTRDDGHDGPHSWERYPNAEPDPLTEPLWQAYCAEVVDPLAEALGLQ